MPIRGAPSLILLLSALPLPIPHPGKAILGLRDLVSLSPFVLVLFPYTPPCACKVAAAAPAVTSSQLQIQWKARFLPLMIALMSWA